MDKVRGHGPPGKTGLRVVNNRQAREAAFDILKAVVSGKELGSIVAAPQPAKQNSMFELQL